MVRTLFLWFLLAHLIGDYYLQTQYLAQAKRQDSKQLIKHSLIYGAVFFVTLLILPEVKLIPILLGIIILHGLIDALKPEMEKYFPTAAYFIDQVIHILVLLLAAWWVGDLSWNRLSWTDEFMIRQILSAAVMVLILAKPANLTIRLLLGKYSPTDKQSQADESLLRGGRLIGTLERWLVFLLLLVNQWAAIGFVFAAKSIVRWKSISKDNTEYFLIGTLLSLIFVVATFYLIYLI